MPTYDYKCTNCGHTFELFQKMSDEPIKECPQCKGLVKRLIGAGAGPIFKGTGFYQTDYKNAPKGEEKKIAKPAAAASENKGEAKTEKKTESKPAEKS